MTKSRDPERLLTAYLADGMDVLPDRVVDAVVDEIHLTRQRAVFGPWRTPGMNNVLKMALATASIAAVVVVGTSFLPSDDSGVGGSGGVSPSPMIAVSPEPSPSPQAARMTVAGSTEAGSTLRLTVQLPAGWTNGNMWAAVEPPAPPAGRGFRVTLVDNTFQDPCSHVQRNPKIGATVEALATALGDIPGSTATEPIQTTIAGYDATYLELAFPISLPCAHQVFYLWQDSPGAYWWLNGAEQLIQVWILEVGGQRVTISTYTYPGTSDESRTELQAILESIVFDSPATNPSPSGVSPSP